MIVCFVLEKMGVACERARLPHLWGAPFALVGPLGKLVVVSEDAALRGVHAGQTPSGALTLCADLTVLPYDLRSYEESAHAFWDLLALETSLVEPVSPELCFLEMTGHDITSRIEDLNLHVGRRLGITIQSGIARSKITAHRAALQNTTLLPTVVECGDEARFLSSVLLTEIPQIPAKTCERLQKLNLRTLGEAAALGFTRYPKSLKEVAYFIAQLARGEDGDPVKATWPPRKITRRFTSDEEILGMELVQDALRLLAKKVAADLGQKREFCRKLSLQIDFADADSVTEQEPLALPTADTQVIFRAALRLFQRLALDQPFVTLTLEAGDLGVAQGVQQTLFDAQGDAFPQERARKLDSTLFRLRKRWGAQTILSLNMLQKKRGVHLWVYPMGRLSSESVQVHTGAYGEPLFYMRGRRRVEVQTIQSRWREREWFWGSTVERTVYRVETDNAVFSELEHEGARWRIRAVAD